MTSPSNFTYQSSILDSSGSNCVADSDCVTLPYCSYMTVETDDSNDFVWGDIGKNDCSQPSQGKRYRWTLETNSVASASNPASYSNTVDDSNSNHWRPVNSRDTSSNSFCTPVNTMVGNGVTTITKEDGQSEILCQCQSNNDQHYALRYYAGSFDSNSPSNIGYSSLSNLQSSNCESNECRARNYYTAQERLVPCTHPDQLASNAQGEPDLGDKYLDITLVNNGLLCYNDNACSNLCLVSGPSTISTQIGDGVYDNEAESNPARCFTHGTNNQQNRFSYTANGQYVSTGSSLRTNMPTCTDLVGSNCSSNQNPNCGQQYNSMNDISQWGAAEYITGTTNSNTTYTDDTTTYEGNVVRFSGTGDVSISNNVVTYNSSCTSGLKANETAQLKKGLFKYVYTHTNNGNNICLPETTTYVKYQVENIDPSDNDYGTHSNCPMDCVVPGTWENWNNNGGTGTVPTIPECDASSNYTRTRRLQSSRYGGAQCEATSNSGQNSYSFNEDDDGNGGAIIETQTYNNSNADSLKPCCASNNDGHFTSSQSYSYTVSAVNSGATGTIYPDTEATYSNLYETNNIPCNTKITKATTTIYTPNSHVCSAGESRANRVEYDTRSNATPCCDTTNPDSNHYDITYTLSKSNGAPESSSESIWNAFSEIDRKDCQSSMQKTYTHKGTGTCILSSGTTHPATVTKTNSQPCDVDCVGSWLDWTPSCDTRCGTGTPTQTRTFSIRTGKRGNGQSCFNVAINDQSLTQQDKQQMDRLPESYKTKNSDSFVITKNCPTNLDCTLPIPPSNVIASNITHNSATITWSNNDNGSIADNHITIKLKYKKTDNSQWQNVPMTNSSSSHTLTNLDSSTSYQVQIIKNVDTSSYSGRTFSGGALSTSYESRITNFDTPDLPECQRKMLPNTSYEYKWYKKKANEPDSSYVSIDDMLFANSYGSWSWMGEQYMYAKRAFSRDVNSTSEQHYVLCTEDPDGTTVKMEPVYVNTSNCRINPGTIRDLWRCGQRSYYTGQPGFGTAKRQRNVDNNWCAYHNVFH